MNDFDACPDSAQVLLTLDPTALVSRMWSLPLSASCLSVAMRLGRCRLGLKTDFALVQFGTQRLPIGDDTVEERVKGTAVIKFAQMAQLVQDDVIDHGFIKLILLDYVVCDIIARDMFRIMENL